MGSTAARTDPGAARPRALWVRGAAARGASTGLAGGVVGSRAASRYGKDVATELGATRYDLAAQGFGCHAEHVVEPGDLAPALQRAFASGKPACVNVMTDGSARSKSDIGVINAALRLVTSRPIARRRKGPA